jgi:hypothetical protein
LPLIFGYAITIFGMIFHIITTLAIIFITPYATLIHYATLLMAIEIANIFSHCFRDYWLTLRQLLPLAGYATPLAIFIALIDSHY